VAHEHFGKMALYRTNCIKHYENVEVIASKSWRVFTTRRHASSICCGRVSVRPSVCHKSGFYQNGSTQH